MEVYGRVTFNFAVVWLNPLCVCKSRIVSRYGGQHIELNLGAERTPSHCVAKMCRLDEASKTEQVV